MMSDNRFLSFLSSDALGNGAGLESESFHNPFQRNEIGQFWIDKCY
jgi:hypothetical protein